MTEEQVQHYKSLEGKLENWEEEPSCWLVHPDGSRCGIKNFYSKVHRYKFIRWHEGGELTLWDDSLVHNRTQWVTEPASDGSPGEAVQTLGEYMVGAKPKAKRERRWWDWFRGDD